MKTDFRNAGLPPRVTALLEFVETVTLAPWEIDGGHWRDLRELGWSDSELAHAALGSAHFNYLNRVADGVGIPFEYTTSLSRFEVPQAERAQLAPRAPAAARVAHAGSDSRPFVRVDPAGVEAATHGLATGEPREFCAILGVNPPAAELVRAWRRYHFTGTERLSTALRVRIALFAAATEHAGPCANWQESSARALGIDDAEIRALAAGAVPPRADALTRFVLDHARRLLQSPWTAKREHVEAMKALGLDERDVLKLTTFVAYLSFEHRAALALGA